MNKGDDSPEEFAVERDAGVLSKGLVAPWRLSNEEALRALCFSAVGAIGYCVNLFTFGALRLTLESPYLLAATVAFLVAAGSNFMFNRIFTFGERSHVLGRGVRSFLTALLVLGLNLALLQILSGASISIMLSQAASVLLVVPVNYMLHRQWVFA